MLTRKDFCDFKKQTKYDITRGIIFAWRKYIPAVLISLMACIDFYRNVKIGMLYGHITSNATFSDYLIYIFKGMKVYIPDPRKQFEIPVIWALINLYIAFIVANYPLNDILTYGQQILVRSRKRREWWLSKCVWNLISVLCFYSIGYISIFSFTLLTGNVSLELSKDINLLVSQINVNGISSRKLVCAVIVLPVLTSIALSQLQMTLAFITKPIYSYIVIVCVLVASVYFTTPFLIGNYSMMLRNSLLLNGGIKSSTAIITDVAIALMSVAVGNIYFKKFDILDEA